MANIKISELPVAQEITGAMNILVEGNTTHKSTISELKNYITAGAGADEIQVLNGTSSPVSIGDKVWFNKVYQEAGTTTTARTNVIYYCVFSDDGSVMVCAEDAGHVGGDTTLYNYNGTSYQRVKSLGGNGSFYTREYWGLTKHGNLVSSYPTIICHPNTQVYIAPYTSTSYAFIADRINLISNGTSLLRFEEDGSTIKTYTGDVTFPGGFCHLTIDDNTFLAVSGSYNKLHKFVLNDENDTYTHNEVTSENTWSSGSNRFYFTPDKKYIVNADGTTLSLYYYNNESNAINSVVLPSVLSDLVSKGISSLRFNPDCGILTGIVDGKIVAYQHEGGLNWSNLSFDISAGAYPEISSDAKRIYYKNSSVQYRMDLSTIDNGFVAQNYSYYTISDKSLIGYAKTNAGVGEMFTVETKMPEQIDVTITVDADNAEITVG